MDKIKGFLNPKVLIPTLVSVVLLGLIGYVLLAPDTMWKPFYIRVDYTDPTPTPTPTPTPEPGIPLAGATPQPGMVGPGGVPLASYLDPSQPLQGIIYNLDTKVVNLAEPGGLRYLQTTIVLEFWPSITGYATMLPEERTLAEDEFKAKIDLLRPKIDDAVMTVLSSKTYDEISTIEGKDQLRQEITQAINKLFGYDAIMNVYFTDFLVQ